MKWDFFLAHTSEDSGTAKRLRLLLEPEATVFEDSMLHAGEDWPSALDRHLRASAITVALVSVQTESAYYQLEEIALAIELARSVSRRRVVPLILEPVDRLPYGLTIKEALKLLTDLDLAGAARKLLASLHDLRGPRREGPREASARIGALLADLDLQARSGGDTELLRAAIDEVGRSNALLLHLRRRGLAPRVVQPSLPNMTSQWHAGRSVRRTSQAPSSCRGRSDGSSSDT